MKNKLYFMSITLLSLVFLNCSKDDSSELQEDINTEIIENNYASKTLLCQGYDIFSNVKYDCGFSKGVEKYVADYNQIIADYGYTECETLSWSFVHNDTSGTTENPIPGGAEIDDPTFTVNQHINIQSVTYNNSGAILQTMRMVFKDYREWCNPRDTDGDYTAGFKRGYLAFWNQQPLSADPTDDCNDGEPSPLS